MICASDPMTIFFSPSLYLSITTCPSTLATVVSTVALVMVVLGRSHGRKPSPTPRCGSANMVHPVRLLTAVGLRGRPDADVVAFLDVRDGPVAGRDHHHVRGRRDLHVALF